MSEFTVLASRDGAPIPPRRLKALARAFTDAYGEASTSVLGDGAAVSCLIVNEPELDIRRFESERGWMALKGVAFDGGEEGVPLSLARIFEGLLHERREWIGRLEGGFALVAWFAEQGELFALNDPASTLNLYLGAAGRDCLATTAVLAPARALGIDPAPAGVREFLARGALLAPNSFFSGIERLNVGQSATLAGDGWRRETHWEPFADTSVHANRDEAAAAYASALVRAVARIDAAAGGLAIDLTGGYDTRMVVAAALRAGVDFTVTTGRAPDEIAMASRIARAMGFDHAAYGPDLFERLALTPDVVRELIHRTAGERDFADIAHASLSLRMLRRRRRTRLQGCMGELTRARHWSYELWNVGRIGPPNVGRLLRFRILGQGPPPAGLYRRDWWPRCAAEMEHRVRHAFRAPAGATRAQRLEALGVWRQTSNPSISLSSTHGWMPSVHPLSTRAVMEAALAIPWRWKLGARVTRAVIQRLSPELAALPTEYGGTAAPFRASTLHRETRHALKYSAHALSRLDRCFAGGRLTRPLPSRPHAGPRPALPDDLLAVLDPERMFSRELFNPHGLAALLADGTDDPARQRHVARILNVELLFRECDFRPDAAFLDATP